MNMKNSTPVSSPPYVLPTVPQPYLSLYLCISIITPVSPHSRRLPTSRMYNDNDLPATIDPALLTSRRTHEAPDDQGVPSYTEKDHEEFMMRVYNETVRVGYYGEGAVVAC